MNGYRDPLPPFHALRFRERGREKKNLPLNSQYGSYRGSKEGKGRLEARMKLDVKNRPRGAA